MKTLIPILTIIWLVVSCSSETVSDNDSDNNSSLEQTVSTTIQFQTPIRPDQDTFDLALNYTDTLIFDGFDDQYDYWYAFFLASNGERIALAKDEPMSNDMIGAKMQVTWEVDSLYQAGEGDELYYKERLIDYEVLELAFDFGLQLEVFYKAFCEKDEETLKLFSRPEVEKTVTYNPGAACVIDFAPPEMEYVYNENLVYQQGFPEGDFCEGYPNAQPGLYWETISDKKEHVYADPLNDFAPVKVKYPDIPVDAVYSVLVIAEEYSWVEFVFLRIEAEIYIWIEDYCDCSA